MAAQAERFPARAVGWPHEAARALGLRPWWLRGRLPSMRTPGGHRHDHRDDVEQAAPAQGLARAVAAHQAAAR